jgi:hypothetical protein
MSQMASSESKYPSGHRFPKCPNSAILCRFKLTGHVAWSARARGGRASGTSIIKLDRFFILVNLGDFGQIPGPSSSLFRRVLLLLLRFCVIIIYCALN